MFAGNVVRVFLIRECRQHPWQVFLSWLGVAIGVAVVMAIDLANNSAKQSFDYANRAVSGTATHRIVGLSGDIDEQVYQRLRRAGLYFSAPVIVGDVTLENDQKASLRVVGIDPLAQLTLLPNIHFDESASSAVGHWVELLIIPGAVYLLRSEAENLRLNHGESFVVNKDGQAKRLTVAGLLTPGNEVEQFGLAKTLLMDIATAQTLLERSGKLSHIDLQINESMFNRAQVKALLPSSVKLANIETGSQVQQQMTRAFQTNLTALSLLALLIGMFLIYNAITFSVIRRRSQIGVLRSIGMTRRQVFMLVLIEAAVIGIIATACGLALGYWLAGGLLTLISQIIDDLYFPTYTVALHASSLSWAKVWILGLGATLLAALLPALEATRTTPSMVLSLQSGEIHNRRVFQFAAKWGVWLLLTGVVICLLPSDSLLVGFTALFLLVSGYSLVIPTLCAVVIVRLSTLPANAGFVILVLGLRRVVASLSRTAPAITALTVAMSAVIGVSIMIDSFRGSVEEWLVAQLRGDVYLSSPASGSGLTSKFLNEVRGIPGVRDVGLGRRMVLRTEQGNINLFVLDIEREAFDGFTLKVGESDDAWNAFQQGDSVLVSEPYAYKKGLTISDKITLPSPAGNKSFKIAGIYSDYASDQGVVLMPRESYRHYWHDDLITSASLYLDASVGAEDVISQISQIDPQTPNLRVRSTQTLREASLAVFDRTFTITSVLRWLALVVAVIGMLAALLAIQLEKARELAIIRAIGLLPRQLWTLLFAETGVMGLLAGVFSIPLGVGMALVLILIINRRSFGWTMQVSVDPMILLQALLLALITAMIAAVYPAYRLSRITPVQALRHE